MEGCILLARSILESDVFASQKMLKIWVWCLCKASYINRAIPLKIGKGEMIVKIKRGEFIFGRFKAEEELFIDGSTIYKIMKKLEVMGNISIKSNNQYSIITICNYDTYQELNYYKVTSNEQVTNSKRTSNEQVTNTNNKDNKDNKVNKDNKYSIPTFEEFKNFAISKKPGLDLGGLELKYEAWKENGWKDGKDQKIKVWKSKLLNTIPYLKTNGIPNPQIQMSFEQLCGQEQLKNGDWYNPMTKQMQKTRP